MASRTLPNSKVVPEQLPTVSAANRVAIRADQLQITLLPFTGVGTTREADQIGPRKSSLIQGTQYNKEV